MIVLSTRDVQQRKCFGNCWDKLDPLAVYPQNQALLAQFAFEETLQNIGYDCGVQI